jgi:hypothetical protein
MSRKTIYRDERFHLVEGEDHAVGDFIQLFDKEMLDETPEGEGLVVDWSEIFGMETNFTGIPGIDALEICIKYLKDNNVDIILYCL